MWKTNYFQRKSMGRSRVASFEPLDHRTLLAGDVINAAAAAEVAENVAQEYFVNHPPPATWKCAADWNIGFRRL